jgi:Domain of unknown function (DUF4114)/Cadherin domain
MADQILNYKFSNTNKTLTGNLSFNQAAAADQQVTLAEGLNISGTYGGKSYTQADDSLATLFTNQSGEIADQGLGLQFVTTPFTVNAENFVDANSTQGVTYSRIYAPTDLVFNTIYNFSNTNKTLTGSFAFNQAAAVDQQVTLDEGLNISGTYGGKSYTQADDSLALLLTNQSGEIADQGLGLQFVTTPFTVNAENFVDANSTQTVTYTRVQAPTNSALSAISVDENIAAGTVLDSFSTTDQDKNSTFIYSLVSGAGSTDNAAFTIDGNNLKINSSPNFETKSTYNIRVKTTDQDGLSFEKPLTVDIKDLNEAPIALALSATSVNENVPANTAIGTFNTTDPDTGNTFTYSLVNGTSDTDNTAFTIAANTLRINASPNFETKSNYNVRVRTTDQGGLSFDKAFTININNLPEPRVLKPNANNVFLVEGDTQQLKLTLTKNNSTQVNEIGVFVVDDSEGRIGSLAPGSNAYTQAALARGQVIFSGLTNPPQGFNQPLSRILNDFAPNTRLAFYAVQNGTTDAVLKGQNQTVLFSNALNVSSQGNNAFSLNWRTPDGSNSLNLETKLESTTETRPLGTATQSRPEGELLDLRGLTTQSVKATFTVNREAAYNNSVGFYRVIDETGAISTGNGIILPGQKGYAEAAVRDAQSLGINLGVENQGTATFNSSLGKALFAPFIISNGTAEQVLNGQKVNDIFFSYLGANSDKVDHIRMLKDNTFGFEDLATGGDFDYNDIVLQVNLT